MPIGNSYPRDVVIEDADLFLGTKASLNNTVNYTAQGIANYLNINGKVSITGQMSFKFVEINGIAKTISFEGGGGNNTPFSNITQFIVSKGDLSGQQVEIFLAYLNGKEILLAHQNEINSFGNYKITGYTVTIDPGFYTLDLEFIGGNGTILKDNYYDLVAFSSSAGGTPYILPTASLTILGGVKIGEGVDIAVDGVISVSTNYQAPLSGSGIVNSSSGTISYISGTSSQYIAGNGSLVTFPTIPTVGTWGTLDYPTWTTGTPFVKMTATGAFSLDTITSSDVTTALGYTPVTNARTLTINGVTQDLTSDRIWAIPTFTSPLTTKGDLFTYNSGNTRLPVGLNNQVLIADSTQPTGLKWSAPSTPTPLGYYGAFQDILTQTLASANIGQPFLIRTVDESNQVSITANGSGQLTRITPANTGVYNIQWSGQFQNPDNAIHDVNVWFRKGLTSSSGPGTDIVGSNGIIAMPARKSAGAGDQGHVIAGWNFLLTIAAGEYVEFYWMSDSTQITLQAYAAGSPPPSTASLIVTVTQQSGIMAGTGITAINSLTGASQTLGVGTSGLDFNIVSTGTSHTFNLPTASSINTGKLSSTDWVKFNSKQDSNTDLVNRRLGYTISIEFLSNLTAALSPYQFNAILVGTLGTITGQIDANHPGVQIINSAAAAANSGGYVTTHTATNTFSTLFTDGLQTDMIFKLPPTTTNNYFRFGHQYGSVTVALPINGNYFEVTGTTLVGITRNTNVQSSTSSFSLTANVWYHMRIKETIVGGTNTVIFLVYDMAGNILINQSLTTNINTTTTRAAMVLGVNTVSATALPIVYLDYIGLTFPPMVRGALN